MKQEFPKNGFSLKPFIVIPFLVELKARWTVGSSMILTLPGTAGRGFYQFHTGIEWHKSERVFPLGELQNENRNAVFTG